MSSPLTDFNECVASFLISRVLEPLADWLQDTKGVAVSVDEMLEGLSIPKAVRSISSPFVGVNPPTFPQHLSGKAASNTSAVSGTKRKPKDENPDAPKCTYKFKKGPKALSGQTCGKPCVDGTEFCSNHKDTKKTTTSTSSSKQTSLKPKTVNTSTIGFTSPNLKSAKQPTLQLRATENPDIFEDTSSNFLVKKVMNNDTPTFIAFGKKEEDEGRIRQLTTNEKAIALRKRFSVKGDEDDEEDDVEVEDDDDDEVIVPQVKPKTPSAPPSKSSKQEVEPRKHSNIPSIPTIDDDDE